MIDCKELSVGDWVLVNFLPAQVFEIAYNRNVKEVTVGILDPQGEIYSCFEGYDRVEPIPLTEEILEKNGEKVECGEFYWYQDCDRQVELSGDKGYIRLPNKWYMRIDTKDRAHIMFQGEITYVHELQHFLRLCGIEKEIEL